MRLVEKIIHVIRDRSANETDIEKISQTIIITFVSLFASLFCIIFTGLSIYQQNYVLAAILLLILVTLFVNLHLYKKSGDVKLASSILTYTYGIVSLYTFSIGGTFGTGFFWVLPFPALAIVLMGFRKGSTISIIYFAVMVGIIALSRFVEFLPIYSLMVSIRIIAIYFTIFLLMYLSEYVKFSNTDILKGYVKESNEENKSKNEFLSKLSHQLRTPLSNITLVSEMVENSNLNKEQRELFDTIIASANNLAVVVDNIVNVSPTTISNTSSNEITFNLSSTIESTLSFFARYNGDKIKYSSHIPVNEEYFGNPIRIKQIFLNISEIFLKSNHSSTPFQIAIYSSQMPESDDLIKVTIELQSEQLKIDKLDRKLFIVDTTTPKHEKTPCDFALVERLIRSMQGDLEIGINKPYILNFSLKLKQPKEVPDTSNLKKETVVIPSSGKKELSEADVLLVEDNAINQKIVLLSLKNKVHSVDVASNGKEALEKFGTKRFDIILMDIQMPVMNGIIATKKIRETEMGTSTKTPILAITANALSGDKEACIAAGMNDYISKPFQVDELLDKMNKLLSE